MLEPLPEVRRLLRVHPRQQLEQILHHDVGVVVRLQVEVVLIPILISFIAIKN